MLNYEYIAQRAATRLAEEVRETLKNHYDINNVELVIDDGKILVKTMRKDPIGIEFTATAEI